MQPETTLEYRSVRRAYEWGRVRSSALRALVPTIAIAVVAGSITGMPALAWLPVTFAAWVFAYWRGGVLLRGAFFGLVAGAITYALPMTVLRPCCSTAKMMMAGADCCTMPAACLGAGAAIGFALAVFVPAGAGRWRTAGGMGVGVASVAILRCSTLFLGEATGLLGGLLAGLAAASMARAILARSTRAPR